MEPVFEFSLLCVCPQPLPNSVPILDDAIVDTSYPNDIWDLGAAVGACLGDHLYGFPIEDYNDDDTIFSIKIKKVLLDDCGAVGDATGITPVGMPPHTKWVTMAVGAEAYSAADGRCDAGAGAGVGAGASSGLP